MTVEQVNQIDYQHWLERWDAQQTGYVPKREERFGVMLDVLEALLPAEFVALDLACGPGAISQRLLARFPKARCVAIDMDPVMLAIGEGALGTCHGRLRWVDGDLAEKGWVESIGEEEVDAVLSTTALHWLSTPHLVALYRQLAALMRPGGVFLNGDNMEFGPDVPTIQRFAAEARDRNWTRLIRGARRRDVGAVVGGARARAIDGAAHRGADAAVVAEGTAAVDADARPARRRAAGCGVSGGRDGVAVGHGPGVAGRAVGAPFAINRARSASYFVEMCSWRAATAAALRSASDCSRRAS